MQANPLLPVLLAIAPERPWPETLDPTSVPVLDQHAIHLAALTHQLAAEAENTRRAASGIATPYLPTDLQMMKWASRAGMHARRVIGTTGIDIGTAEGDALLTSVTAALMLRDAEFTLGRNNEHHHKSWLNRALNAGEWVRLSLAATPTGSEASHAFVTYLPPGWRWELHPWDDDRATDRFRIAHPLPGGAHERITVTGAADERVEIVHEHVGTSSVTSPMNWSQTCQHLARSFVRPQPDTPRPAASQPTTG